VVDHVADALVALRLALRQQVQVATLAAVKSMAEAFGQAATQAPQPMHSAASIARSASSFGTGIALASGALPGAHRDVAAGLDDPVERRRGRRPGP
jgi:hypothetical protein